jgi:DNA-binding IclR family transcriptional regulator
MTMTGEALLIFTLIGDIKTSCTIVELSLASKIPLNRVFRITKDLELEGKIEIFKNDYGRAVNFKILKEKQKRTSS